MNENECRTDDPLDALFALARARRADTSSVEYAFETRLLARVRAARETESIWALVSWRMLPVFASCVMALAIWQSQTVTEANDAAAIASTDTPEVVDLWNSLN